MFQKTLAIGAASFVIFLTAQSVSGNQKIDSANAAFLKQNTYDSFLKRKLSAMDRCDSESINIFFSDPYVTYHSAELVNSAFQRMNKCKIKNIKVELYDAGNALPAPASMKVEISAFVEAHAPNHRPEYEVLKVKKTTPILNGLGATIHFET